MTVRARAAAVATTLALALALVGCGGEQGPAHNDADVEFAQMMIIHHEGAVEMADLALERAEDGQVLDLARDISAAQGPEIELMTSWLTAWDEPVTPEAGHDHGDHGGMEMEGMDHASAMAELDGLDGTAFDRRFLELMISHHEGAVVMAEAELADGENDEALDLAQQIIDDQTAEIAAMTELLADL